MTTRALVLGAGGPVGVAWESGLIAGFALTGVDLARSDFILGTSAGSIVGARLALGVPPVSLADALLQGGRPNGEAMLQASAAALAEAVPLLIEAQGGTGNPAEARRKLGAFALAAETAPEEAFLAQIGGWFGELQPERWPERDFACTAVDAEDGGFQLWGAKSGVDLVRAVASSCCVPGLAAPVTIQGRRYMDGAARSLTNADLAGGYDVTVVVAVQTAAMAPLSGARLDEEVESLKAGGGTVVTITPDDDALEAIGENLMDFSRSAEVARAGLAQGARQGQILATVWG